MLHLEKKNKIQSLPLNHTLSKKVGQSIYVIMRGLGNLIIAN